MAGVETRLQRRELKDLSELYSEPEGAIPMATALPCMPSIQTLELST